MAIVVTRLTSANPTSASSLLSMLMGSMKVVDTVTVSLTAECSKEPTSANG